MEIKSCPPINILLNPDQAEDDARRTQMDEHVAHCEACRELRELAKGWPKHQTNTNQPTVEQFGKLLREVTFTVVHLYRHGVPKCYMVKYVEHFAQLVHAMLSHQPKVMETLGPLEQTERDDIASLWIDATKGALMILIRGESVLESSRLHHDAVHAWASGKNEIIELINKFSGPCQKPKEKK